MLIVFFSLTLCVFFSFTLFFSIVRQSAQTMKAEEEAQRLAQQVEIDALSYRKMMSSIEQARAARHDVRHHMRQIGSMLKKGDREGAEAYTQTYMERMDVQSQVTVCQNYLVNNIVLYYLDLCQKDGIELRHRIVLPELPGISPVDLTVLFSNILENALNACRQVTEGITFIDLRAECIGASLDCHGKQPEAQSVSFRTRQRSGDEKCGRHCPGPRRPGERWPRRQLICNKDQFVFRIAL